jgi:hypothetical protein
MLDRGLVLLLVAWLLCPKASGPAVVWAMDVVIGNVLLRSTTSRPVIRVASTQQKFQPQIGKYKSNTHDYLK